MSASTSGAYIREAPIAAMPAPLRNRGVWGWMREHLLSSWLNVALTALSLLALWWIVPPLLNFLIFDATWTGSDRTACIATPDRPRVGACWAGAFERINFFVYGFYPMQERWRVNVFFALLAIGIVLAGVLLTAGCGGDLWHELFLPSGNFWKRINIDEARDRGNS